MHVFLAVVLLPIIVGMWAYKAAKPMSTGKITSNPSLTRREFLMFWLNEGERK